MLRMTRGAKWTFWIGVPAILLSALWWGPAFSDWLSGPPTIGYLRVMHQDYGYGYFPDHPLEVEIYYDLQQKYLKECWPINLTAPTDSAQIALIVMMRDLGDLLGFSRSGEKIIVTDYPQDDGSRLFILDMQKRPDIIERRRYVQVKLHTTGS